MGVDARHPEYGARLSEWQVMRDCMRGETAIKERSIGAVVARPIVTTNPDTQESAITAASVPAVSTGYLPMPDGFRAQADGGRAMYEAYALRAQFPDILAPTVRGMVGLIHRKEAQIVLPKALEPLYEQATLDGLPLEAFHRRITTEILETGRFAVLPDLPQGGADVPHLAGYCAENLINWTADRTLFVLDESSQERVAADEFQWQEIRRFRVLRLTDGAYTQQVYEGGGLSGGDVITPTLRGGTKALQAIPLVVIGARDLVLPPDDPPLLGVARACIALYRLDADYRHQLFLSGQETFVVIGADGAPSHIGAGVVISLPLGADAKYVGPSGSGIEAHRTAIQDEREAAASAGARLFDARKAGVESGEALRIRLAAQGATLVSVALAGAQGLEKALKNAAVMVGANPNEVVVKPNLEFVDSLLEPKAAVELMKLWQGGAISFETFYENLQRGGIASDERTAGDEQDLIETQPPDVGGEIRDVARAAA